MTNVSGASARIVVGVDGSPSSLEALDWAARQASMTGAAVEATTTWQFPMSFGFPMPVADGWDPEADAKKVIDGAIQEAGKAHPGVTITAHVREGNPAQVLVEASEGAELLVLGCRGHNELAGLLIGSVSEHCAAHAHCPVLVVRH
jgi:nucleotide-binding universal stress UspA family protein